ncbi:MAG TPA: DUF222 domain-containing protein [Acidimicrobiia bacterium]|nr:DUF222 domain-containing protein [Acidimicrobiia bacterium]
MFGTSERVLELLEQRERLDAELLGAVGDLDASREWSADGTASTHAWLVHHGRVTRPEASRLLRGGRLVHRHERSAKRLHEGAIRCAQLDALARAVRGHEELFADQEEGLLDVAAMLSPEQFRIVMRRWRAIADDVESGDEPNRSWDLRRLHVSTLDDGSVHLDGRLDPVAGEAFLAALDKFMDPTVDPSRTAAQRRADALHEMARRALGSAAPVELGVIIDAETFAGNMPADPRAARCDLAHVGPVAPSSIRRLACDAIMRRIVCDDDGEILDLGRRTRIVSAAQRKAVMVRDGGCTWPGCDRPPEWCDVHHDEHWANGGPTDLENLRAYCRYHHTRVHGERRRRGGATSEPP